jgi:hypothetical protein
MTKIELGQYAGRMERRTYCGMGRMTNDSPLLRQRLILLSDWQSICIEISNEAQRSDQSSMKKVAVLFCSSDIAATTSSGAYVCQLLK